MPLRPGLLDRIRQEIDKRVRTELTPEGPADYADEAIAPGLGQRIKDKIKEKLTELSPIQKRLLDPNAPLDLATLKWRARYCGKNSVLALVKYNNMIRHCEVYSWRYNGKNKSLRLFMYCRAHDSIHSFNPNKIQAFLVTSIPYRARWTIEF